MKKFLKGCGIVVLISVVLLVGGIIFATLKIRSTAKQVTGTITEMQTLNTEHPFTKPAANAMDAARLNDFFTVRTSIMQLLEKDEVIAKLKGNKNPKLGFSDFTHLALKLPQIIAKEFKAQLEAKNMSPNEYSWFVRTIYSTIYDGKMDGDKELIPLYDTLDENLTQFNLQVQQMKQSGTKPVGWDAVISPPGSIDEATKTANRDLVLAHKEAILDYPQLAFLELMFSRSVQDWSTKTAPALPAGS